VLADREEMSGFIDLVGSIDRDERALSHTGITNLTYGDRWESELAGVEGCLELDRKLAADVSSSTLLAVALEAGLPRPTLDAACRAAKALWRIDVLAHEADKLEPAARER